MKCASGNYLPLGTPDSMKALLSVNVEEQIFKQHTPGLEHIPANNLVLKSTDSVTDSLSFFWYGDVSNSSS